MTVVALTLDEGLLKIRCDSNGLSDDRELSDNDFSLLKQWSGSYLFALSRDSNPDTLRHIGREMCEWLDGGERCLKRVINAVEPPLLLEFCAAKTDPRAREFLDAPWELVADESGHWAERDSLAYCPVRRLGGRSNQGEPSPYKLTAVFMAAAPKGVGQLRFEDEEASILKATRDSGMELVVEESGTLELLRACVVEEKPDVVHISCHGTLKPEPALLLEDEFGDSRPASMQDLLRGLAGQKPRLLFLSACQTAMTDDVVSSLVWSLVQSAAPAMIGWAGSVRDHEAAEFARFLYRRLAEGEPSTQAVAYARLDLLLPQPSRRLAVAGGQSRDWHLARLYLGPSGGGVLATGRQGRRGGPRGYAYKAFLNRQKQEVPVAGPFEFVGRRRQLQSILREFHKPDGERKAGVFIHGLGRQGKSSLAARVADRLEARDYKVLVVHGRYDASAILQVFREFAGRTDVDAVVKAHLKAVDESPENLQTALAELLEGPCCQVKKDNAEKILEHPVLLIIDDFEQALEGQRGGGRHRLKSNCVESIRATIKAFDRAATDSRLLFTSRFQFTLPDAGRELANLLFDLPLPPMESYESEKQAAAKLKTSEDSSRAQVVARLESRIERIVQTSKGNPGLQDWLYRMAVENPESCDRCLDDIGGFLQRGEQPDEQEVLKFLERLALKSIVELLSPAQKEVLRASTLFQLPVPEPVMTRLAQAAGLSYGPDDLARLSALGLWDVYENSFSKGGSAVAINPLVRPLARTLNENEEIALAGLAANDLFNGWGGPEGGNQRSSLHDFELTRLALLARQGEVLLHTAEYAVRWLERQFEYPEAAEIGEAAIGCIEQARQAVPLGLRRATAENDLTVGEVQRALVHLENALQEIERTKQEGRPVDPQDHGALLLSHARLLMQAGRPDDALLELEQARGLFKAEEDRAVTLGDIARLLADKGEVDKALKLHQERLVICEALGDKRSRAVTLSYIARLLADKGEVDKALKLHQENLVIYEALGDKWARAVTLDDIARLLADKGEVDKALKLHQENLVIYEALGNLEGVANALWSIAKIELRQRHIQQAFEHLAASYDISLKLGRLDAICQVGQDFGQLLCARGDPEKGLAVLERSRDGFVKLARQENARYVESIIDEIQGK